MTWSEMMERGWRTGVPDRATVAANTQEAEGLPPVAAFHARHFGVCGTVVAHVDPGDGEVHFDLAAPLLGADSETHPVPVVRVYPAATWQFRPADLWTGRPRRWADEPDPWSAREGDDAAYVSTVARELARVGLDTPDGLRALVALPEAVRRYFTIAHRYSETMAGLGNLRRPPVTAERVDALAGALEKGQQHIESLLLRTLGPEERGADGE